MDYPTDDELDTCLYGNEVARAIVVLAKAAMQVSRSIIALGNNGAVAENGADMGGMEALGMVLKEGFSELSTSIDQLSNEHNGLSEVIHEAFYKEPAE